MSRSYALTWDTTLTCDLEIQGQEVIVTGVGVTGIKLGGQGEMQFISFCTHGRVNTMTIIRFLIAAMILRK